VLADSDFLFDGLKRRMREVEMVGEVGGIQRMRVNDPVFTLEDVGVAFTILHLLHERGEVLIREWGNGGR
jgi:hypothetical protein